MAKYIQEFKNKQDVIDQYHASKHALDGAKMYLAWYGYGSYCGSSLVVYEKGGRLYEVNGSHCSCYGLEGQWEPEETSWNALSMRDLSGECEGSYEAHLWLKGMCAKHLALMA